ncbi:MAG: ABC transporter substrate-binding protein [Brachybacterium tyrofermentans]|uniref:ABC transporter substrate-binding protein n=1 Tax=Brachybacterium tyrofermentans TaxID=47848 RepID=UPI0018692372|nr:extracellular solute-binding protein [Brachybacterium tyrofermentans]
MSGFTRRQILTAGLGLTAAGVATSTAACSSGGANSDSSAEDPSGELSIMVSSANASDSAFEQVNKDFQEKFPDVTVKFTTVPNDTYEASLSSRLTAKNVDIFVAKSMSIPPSYAEGSEEDSVRLALAGGMLELTDQAFIERFDSSVLETITLEDKLFVVPTGLSYTTGLYYNKDIFEAGGLEVPTTYAELQEVLSSLKDAGTTPFGIGGKESWPAGLYMLAAVEGLFPSADAKADLAEKLWSNEVKLTDPDLVEILKRVDLAYQNAQDNFAGASYDAVPGGFASGDFAMIADGTWNQPVVDAAVDGAFEYGYFPTPMGDDAASNDHLTGKVELMLGVATDAPNQGAALAWLDFFSEKETYTSFIETAGYSSAQPDIEQSEFLESIAAYTEEFSTPWSHYWFANNKAGQDAAFPFNYPGVKPLGSGTPEQAADAAQKAWGGAF